MGCIRITGELAKLGIVVSAATIYTGSFDAVFAADGIATILTPHRSPRANAFAERWVRTVRRECLDWILVLGRGHLERVLGEYVMHDNQKRPAIDSTLRRRTGRTVRSTRHTTLRRFAGATYWAG